MIDTYAAGLSSVFRRSSQQDVEEGRAWYPLARGEVYDLAKRYRFSIKRAAFAAAALSNNMEWSQNVALLDHVMFSVRNFTEPRGHYPQCLTKAVGILQHGDFSLLQGPKVVPFAHAILGNPDAAVIDRWMYRAAGELNWPTERRSRDIAVALRMLARGSRFNTATLQAIIWTTIRRETSNVNA